MIKLDFKDNVGYLKSRLNDGDIIEVSYMGDTRITRVKVEDGGVVQCPKCVFSRYGSPCRFLISPTYIKNSCTRFSPCNTKLLDDGKEYKFKFCIHYEDISHILEDL